MPSQFFHYLQLPLLWLGGLAALGVVVGFCDGFDCLDQGCSLLRPRGAFGCLLDLLFDGLLGFLVLFIFSCPVLFYWRGLGWSLENAALPGVLTGIGIVIVALLGLGFYADKVFSSPDKGQNQDPNFSADEFINSQGAADLQTVVKLRSAQPQEEKYIIQGQLPSHAFTLFSQGWFLVVYCPAARTLEYTVSHGATKFIRRWTNVDEEKLTVLAQSGGQLNELESCGAQKIKEEVPA